jgi:DNA-binding transcriptional LysR family regulator
MDWDLARVFLSVARTGQFLAAGRQLKLDHATVARRVAILEDTLGQPLVERRTNGVRLNSAGERFLLAAERIESEMLQATSDLKESEIDLAGTVRVAAPDGFGAWFLAPRFGQLMRRHPRLSLQLAPITRGFSLTRREADLAVTIERPRGARLSVRKLADYGLGFYAARDYLARCPAPATLDGLREHTFVTYVQDLQYADALNYLPESFGADQRRFECASVIGQMEAVRAGAGIGILHHYAARAHADLVPVLSGQRFERSYWLIAHLDTRNLARIAAVHQFIVDAVAEREADFP